MGSNEYPNYESESICFRIGDPGRTIRNSDIRKGFVIRRGNNKKGRAIALPFMNPLILIT